MQFRGDQNSQHQRRLREHEPFSSRVAEPTIRQGQLLLVYELAIILRASACRGVTQSPAAE
jgi:hypothetical protein